MTISDAVKTIENGPSAIGATPNVYEIEAWQTLIDADALPKGSNGWWERKAAEFIASGLLRARVVVVKLSDAPAWREQIAKKVLTRLTIKGSYSWSGIGYVAKGDSARKVQNGPLVEGPWAYGYPLSHVLDNHGGTGAEQASLRAAGLLVEVNGGERFEIDGTLYEVVVIRRGRDAWVDFRNVEA